MIPTVGLVHVYRHAWLQFYFLVLRTPVIYASQLLTTQYSIVNYSHHTVHYIHRTYLVYNWKFVPLDPVHPFCSHPNPDLWQPPVFYLWVHIFFFFLPYNVKILFYRRSTWIAVAQSMWGGGSERGCDWVDGGLRGPSDPHLSVCCLHCSPTPCQEHLRGE